MIAARIVARRMYIPRMGLQKVVVVVVVGGRPSSRARVKIRALGRALHRQGAVVPARRIDVAGVRLHREIRARVRAARQNVAVAVRLFVRVRHLGGA